MHGAAEHLTAEHVQFFMNQLIQNVDVELHVIPGLSASNWFEINS
jgi:hypothetical protein